MRQQIQFSPVLFATHLFLIAAVFTGNIAANHDPASWLNSTAGLLLSGTVLGAAILLVALACFPFKVLLSTAHETSPAWHYATLAGIAAWFLRSPSQLLWIQSSAAKIYLLQIVTFRSVQALLGVLLPNLVVDAGPFVIGTPRFSVSVGAPCSGIEGLALILVFTTVWLWFFRRELRFPRALALIPCALLCAFVLNVLRIAILILIGNAGAPEVAFIGFHSQAGWIAFTVVALSFSMATQRLPWVRKIQAPAPEGYGLQFEGCDPQFEGYAPEGYGLQPVHNTLGKQRGFSHRRTVSAPAEALSTAESPATAAYLVPFLAILAASFISKSASGYFEWLYPLRFVLAVTALWIFRRHYRTLNWRFGWLAPLTGAAIFLIWLAPELLSHAQQSSPIGPALATLNPAARFVWIAFRIAAAVLTVPIAEELAFRGYLTRRFIARDFDQVPFTRLTLLSIALSSVLFGLMHGHQWPVGIIAGLAYALLLKSKARIGDAVVAHAVSNLLLAIWILTRSDWALW